MCQRSIYTASFKFASTCDAFCCTTGVLLCASSSTTWPMPDWTIAWAIGFSRDMFCSTTSARCCSSTPCCGVIGSACGGASPSPFSSASSTCPSACTLAAAGAVSPCSACTPSLSSDSSTIKPICSALICRHTFSDDESMASAPAAARRVAKSSWSLSASSSLILSPVAAWSNFSHTGSHMAMLHMASVAARRSIKLSENIWSSIIGRPFSWKTRRRSSSENDVKFVSASSASKFFRPSSLLSRRRSGRTSSAAFCPLNARVGSIVMPTLASACAAASTPSAVPSLARCSSDDTPPCWTIRPLFFFSVAMLRKMCEMASWMFALLTLHSCTSADTPPRETSAATRFCTTSSSSSGCGLLTASLANSRSFCICCSSSESFRLKRVRLAMMDVMPYSSGLSSFLASSKSESSTAALLEMRSLISGLTERYAAPSTAHCRTSSGSDRSASSLRMWLTASVFSRISLRASMLAADALLSATAARIDSRGLTAIILSVRKSSALVAIGSRHDFSLLACASTSHSATIVSSVSNCTPSTRSSSSSSRRNTAAATSGSAWKSMASEYSARILVLLSFASILSSSALLQASLARSFFACPSASKMRASATGVSCAASLRCCWPPTSSSSGNASLVTKASAAALLPTTLISALMADACTVSSMSRMASVKMRCAASGTVVNRRKDARCASDTGAGAPSLGALLGSGAPACCARAA
eukprot:Unigene13769_Nuclearia_a/m.41624 Unigene13769_Nuclearia_a/g.41624  ORF Unigene13769_Nuclearia_a/g.41624 Unigene13769_Nuclearia_a/m.41624 type:complete len:706 (-) Unigene13769_Nuclearia_a:740-2857(-)